MSDDTDALLAAVAKVLRGELAAVHRRIDALDEGLTLRSHLHDHLDGLLTGITRHATELTRKRARVIERGPDPLPPCLEGLE